MFLWYNATKGLAVKCCKYMFYEKYFAEFWQVPYSPLVVYFAIKISFMKFHSTSAQNVGMLKRTLEYIENALTHPKLLPVHERFTAMRGNAQCLNEASKLYISPTQERFPFHGVLFQSLNEASKA